MAKWKSNLSDADKKAWAEAKAAQLENAKTLLKEGVANVYTSGKYADYLRFFSGFHQYSFRNTLLIMLQLPEASMCASYADWKKRGRQVRKGEKGLQILVPTPKKFKVENEDGSEEELSRMFFKTGSVFDISQTDGDPVPSLTNKVDISVNNFAEIMDGIRAVAPVQITFEEIDGSANGYYSRAENRIVVKSGLPEGQTIKTAIHETAHSILHCEGGKMEKESRETKELQAESVAFIVCNFLGIDTSEYSFGYVAGWASDRSGKMLEKNLAVIGETAKLIIDQLEKEA